jgi:hypothetical protein
MGGDTMAENTKDPFEQGKLARVNGEPRKNPHPENTEPYRRWEAGYRFIEEGLTSV